MSKRRRLIRGIKLYNAFVSAQPVVDQGRGLDGRFAKEGGQTCCRGGGGNPSTEALQSPAGDEKPPALAWSRGQSMSALLAAVDVLNDRLIAADAIGEALDLAGGEDAPAWVRARLRSSVRLLRRWNAL